MVYLLLALLALGCCAYTVARSDAKAGLLSVYLVAWTLVVGGDWWVHSIFNLYRFHPGLSPVLSQDTAWGVALAEFAFLPALNVVLTAYMNLWGRVILGTLLVSAIEFVFTRLGLFSYHGWRLWHTLVLFPFYFLAVGLYWRQVRHRGMTDPILQGITRWAALTDFVTLMSLTVWATRVTSSDLWLLPTPESNSSMVRIFVHGVGVLLGYWALTPARWADRWARLALTALGMIVVNDVVEGLRLLVFRRPMSGVLDAAAVTVITMLVGVITDWIFGLAGTGGERRGPAWEVPDL